MKNKFHTRPKQNQQGFTIIELMIATTVFAIIMVIVTFAVLSVTNSFIEGDIQSQTQDTARSVLTDIAQDIKFNKPASVILTGNNPGVSGTGYFCIGNHAYSYVLGREITDSGNAYHALLVGSSTCGSAGLISDLSLANGGGSSNQELLAKNMRLGELSITQPTLPGGASASNIFDVTVTVVYGPDNAMNQTASGYVCQPQSFGIIQFCAVSTLTTTVSSRIN